MIKLTRLDGREIILNADEIETVDSAHHSTISMKSGKKFVVSESGDDIIEKVIDFRKKCCGDPAETLPKIKTSGESG